MLVSNLVNNRVQRFATNLCKVNWLLNSFVYQTNDWNIVASDDFQTKWNLFHSRGGWEDPFMSVIQDEVDKLVKA